MAGILESVEEDIAVKTVEEMQELVEKEAVSLNVYKIKDEIGKFEFCSNSSEDVLNFALKVRYTFSIFELPKKHEVAFRHSGSK